MQIERSALGLFNNMLVNYLPVHNRIKFPDDSVHFALKFTSRLSHRVQVRFTRAHIGARHLYCFTSVRTRTFDLLQAFFYSPLMRVTCCLSVSCTSV